MMFDFQNSSEFKDGQEDLMRVPPAILPPITGISTYVQSANCTTNTISSLPSPITNLHDSSCMDQTIGNYITTIDNEEGLQIDNCNISTILRNLEKLVEELEYESIKASESVTTAPATLTTTTALPIATSNTDNKDNSENNLNIMNIENIDNNNTKNRIKGSDNSPQDLQQEQTQRIIFGSETVSKDSTTPYTDATLTKKHPPNHIKRPMNAFMLFGQMQRRQLADTGVNVDNAEMSKDLGRKWKELSDAEKQPYYKEAAKLKELHAIEYPDYKYKPKKKAPLDNVAESNESNSKQSCSPCSSVGSVSAPKISSRKPKKRSKTSTSLTPPAKKPRHNGTESLSIGYEDNDMVQQQPQQRRQLSVDDDGNIYLDGVNILDNVNTSGRHYNATENLNEDPNKIGMTSNTNFNDNQQMLPSSGSLTAGSVHSDPEANDISLMDLIETYTDRYIDISSSNKNNVTFTSETINSTNQQQNVYQSQEQERQISIYDIESYLLQTTNTVYNVNS